MGTIALCECCLLKDHPEDTTTDDMRSSDSSDSTSLSDSTSSDEEMPLRKKKRSKSKRSRKRKRKKKKRNKERDLASMARDESYIKSGSDDEENEGSRDKQRRRKKRKSRRKKERNNESPLMEDIQRKLMEKSQNEIEKSNNEDNHADILMGLYGMDAKTMELLMSVGDLGAQSPPKPSMASVPSNPLASVEYNDQADEALPPLVDDMSAQLKSYTSDMMVAGGASNVNKADDDDAYDLDDLILDNDDTTPALPIITADVDKKLDENQRKSLGGLDYDFAHEELETPPETTLQALNTLQEDEKNLDFSRLHKTLAHARDKDPNKVEAMIKAQYSNKDDMETDDSSLDEEERQEIQRRKTDSFTKQTSSKKVLTTKLLRPGTTTAWHEDEMDAMKSAMNKHMEALKKHNSKPEDSTEDTDDFGSGDEDTDKFPVDLNTKIMIKPGSKGQGQSQLFRKKSEYKWDADRVDQENEEMQAELASLMMEHQRSIENK